MKNTNPDKTRFNYIYLLVISFLSFASDTYGVYDLNDVKREMLDKGWAFLDAATPIITVGGGLLGAFLARNMDWGARAVGFGTGTLSFGLASQGVKAYYGL